MAYVPISSCQNRKEGLEENASLLLKRAGWDGMGWDGRRERKRGYVLALVKITNQWILDVLNRRVHPWVDDNH